jgi:hypothetical protein
MVNVGGCLRTCFSCSICFCWLLLHAKEKGEKSERWDPLSWRRASCRSWRGGVWALVRCGGDGGGVSARGVVGHRTKRKRGGERDEERVGDADATMYDKLKRGSWNGYKMDKI